MPQKNVGPHPVRSMLGYAIQNGTPGTGGNQRDHRRSPAGHNFCPFRPLRTPTDHRQASCRSCAIAERRCLPQYRGTISPLARVHGAR